MYLNFDKASKDIIGEALKLPSVELMVSSYKKHAKHSLTAMRYSFFYRNDNTSSLDMIEVLRQRKEFNPGGASEKTLREYKVLNH